jgi:NHLM bacteriocin system ABC transporter peptidase/ATP-binding protein
MTTTTSENAATARVRARVRTPSILQMEAVECGAASLAMILAHSGRWVPLEEMRVAVKVSRDGSDARSLLRAARDYGMIAKAYRLTADALKDQHLPLIVFWNRNHFLVVEGFDGGRWFLNDPASGPRVVDNAEFIDSFSGVALTFEPGPDFRPGGRPPSAARELLRRLRPFTKAVLFVLCTSLLLVVPGLAVPALTRAFVDGYVVAGQPDFLWFVLVGLGATLVIQLLLSLLQQRVLLTVRTALSTGIFAGQNERLLRLSMRFFLLRATSDVAYRAGLGNSIASVLSGPLISTVIGTAVGLIYLAIIFTVSWLLGLLVLVIAAGIFAMLRFTGRAQRALSGRQMRQQINAAVVESGTINLIESVKAQGGEDDAIAAISAARAELLTVRQQQDVSTVPLQVIPSLLSSLGTLTLLSVGAVQVMNGSLSLGSLLAVQILTGSVMSPLSSLASLGNQIQTLTSTLARLGDIEHAPVDVEIEASQSHAGGSDIDIELPLRGAVEFRDVSFDYAGSDTPFIQHFDLVVEPGSRVALVGSSGSGKSTIGRLLVGLLQPMSGQVLIDGRSRPSVDRRILADGIGFVDQDVNLFAGSIRENITMWDPTVTESAVIRALSDADLGELVAERGGGWDAALGHKGNQLSGGQQQRVEIARALVRDPAVLVLDEATSALDPISEQAIGLALRRRRCTTVQVAHRLSTVRDADVILVIDHGRIVERGRHDELMALNGRYCALVLA